MKFAEELGRRAARRQVARSGRLVRGEAIRRELDAAGGHQGNGTTFNYPKGSKVANEIRDLLKRII